MGIILSLLRTGAALVLGVIVFVGFLFFLILNNFSDKLLNADFYTDTIEGQDSYNRIYDEVLVDGELLDKTKEFLGDIQIVTHQDIVDLMREIVPPDYIQWEVEENIDRAIAYTKEEVDELDIHIDLAEPLTNVKPVMFAYIDRRIDELEEEDPGVGSCSPETLTGLANRYLDVFNALADGEVPSTVPSLKAMDRLCRELLFASSYDLLLASSNLDAEVRRRLVEKREELQQPFEAGETLAVLKVSARTLAGPLMDEAIARVREDLSSGDRLDLIHQLAEWHDTSEEQIRADLAEGRKWISRADSFGELTTLIMVILGAILMGLVFYPRLDSMLRWPGIILLFTGGLFFVLGKIAETTVPDRLVDVVENGADKVTDVPQAVTDLGGDLLISFGTQVTSGIAGPSLTLLIVGAVLLAASFFTVPIKIGARAIKRSIPFLNNSDRMDRPIEPVEFAEPDVPAGPDEWDRQDVPDEPDGLNEPDNLDEPKEPAP
ncbi:MAG: hypothetical protein BZY87_09010 [SAR202 cluster bacterium Io17-Chloro-G6]|nr:MAG: hypothetical protein BZY87_09010 [SAR202 cluster bacterium Io17-Chloro-G6]